MNGKTVVSLTGTLAMLAVAAPAHAYLDPSTGSIILQATIGAIAGATLFARTFLYRIKSALFGSKSSNDK
ncbi:MAG: hypothetical protein C0515_10705 [Novosphingobium sp.]|nr:hypothetical protein [Novosphingobium sp.]MBX9645212.1 hypothetical protein [Novosphingobium sp.]